ncbi:MAG: hypothetical protein RLZ75_2721, partial [Pseudomonadota bacterium]
GAGTGTQAGTYQSNLRLSDVGDDSSNYNVTFNNAPLTIAGVPPGPVGPNINPVTPIVVPPVGPKPVGPTSSSGTFKTASVEDEEQGGCSTYLKGDQKVNKYALNIEVCQLGNKKDKKDKKDDKDIVS